MKMFQLASSMQVALMCHCPTTSWIPRRLTLGTAMRRSSEDGMMARSWRMTEFGRGCSTMYKRRVVLGRILNCPENTVLLWKKNFRKNGVPEPKEKHSLALQLNLLHRQVEVWFQNRQARTKLKKTKMNCDLLKRYNEALRDEKIKLRIALEILKALKMSPPLRPASTVTMCPSCKRVSAVDNSSHLALAKSGSVFLRSFFQQ